MMQPKPTDVCPTGYWIKLSNMTRNDAYKNNKLAQSIVYTKQNTFQNTITGALLFKSVC